MHIRRVEIENIRSIKHLVWELPEEKRSAGWHVILGDNGSGKTSFAKSISLSLIGYKNIDTLRQDWARWLRSDSLSGIIKSDIDLFSDDGYSESKKATSKIMFTRHGKYMLGGAGMFRGKVDIMPDIRHGKYDTYEKNGFMSMSLGAHRKLTGIEKGYENIFNSYPRIWAHISIFDEDVALDRSIKWYSETLLLSSIGEDEGAKESSKLLNDIISFFNQPDFLPAGIFMSGAGNGAINFKMKDGLHVEHNELSDGIKSFVLMNLEILHCVYRLYQSVDIFKKENDFLFVGKSGIVIIDEIDLHFHPEWQRKIGYWFKKFYPYLQFIVTTHSPLICWAADSVFVLPTPGTDETGRFLTEEELNRVKYGSIQEAYMLDAFGEIGRSDEGQEKLVRLTELNNKEWDGELTEADKKELQELRAALPLSALRMKG